MPNFSVIWAGFMGSMRDAWAAFMNLISTLTAVQLLLGLAAIAVALWILKTILSPGGARKRMKGIGWVWIMIPFILAVGGVIVYFMIQFLSKAPQIIT